MNVLKNYLELTKPKVVLMMLITAIIGMLLASKTLPSIYLVIISMIGIGLCASSAATINQIIDRNIDANMTRTSKRPLPQGEITTLNASLFAFALMAIGTAILISQVNILTAALTVASLIGYAFIYTVFLKRATPQNIVIGGLAGAAPPLLGWTSVTNSIDPNALLLVLIIFVWTPPHFWALAIYRKDDYARESIPMLPVTHGIRFTKLQIILYTILLVLVSLLPFIVLMSGNIYLFSALGLGIFYLYSSIKMYLTDDEEYPMTSFKYSIYYIFLIFFALLVDHFI
jgi:protoheme IX farnesyltransferase